MKIRTYLAVTLLCLTATLALAADTGIEGTWVTDGVALYDAAVAAKKSTSNLPEAVTIKFKVDEKKNTISGSVVNVIQNIEYQVKDGKITDKTFTFNSLESGAQNPKPLVWQGELKEPNTMVITLMRDGKPSTTVLTLHRPVKK